jgi:hypothetical protein
MQKGPFDCARSQDDDRAVIKMAIETLTKVIASRSGFHSNWEWGNHDELIKLFDDTRCSLDQLPDRNWDAEIELKTAYNGALDVLEMSFNIVIAKLRKLR